MFHLEDDQLELGLGIHGEAGIERLSVGAGCLEPFCFVPRKAS